MTRARDLASNSSGSKPTLIDAKADLIVGTGADAASRLAVGSNGDTIVADSAASTGLRWQASQAAGKNYAINGSFDIWQRGTSSTSSGVYLADRWIHGRAGGAAGGTYTRQTATDASTLPFIQYAFRLQRDSGNSSTAQLNVNQVIETINSVPLAGRTVTLSFYARVGANYSATSGNVIAYLFTGTGTDQNGVLGAWTGSANPLSTTFSGATTSWQRFQASATLSTTTNEIYFGIGFNPTGTAGAADWLEITGVQLELGSVATTFTRTGGTIQGELAACQRYYYRHTASGAYTFFCNGNAYNTTIATTIFPLPVTMRTAPSALETSGTASHYRLLNGATATACSAVPSFDQGGVNTIAINFTVASGLTAGQAINAGANNTTSAFLGVSAEL